MKSKAEPNPGVKPGSTAPSSSGSASSGCNKNTPPGNTVVSTGGGSDQISSGVGPTNNTSGQIKNVNQQNVANDSDSNSDNHCGTGGIGGGSSTAPHSVGSSVSGGDRGTPIGTPGIGHPPSVGIIGDPHSNVTMTAFRTFLQLVCCIMATESYKMS